MRTDFGIQEHGTIFVSILALFIILIGLVIALLIFEVIMFINVIRNPNIDQDRKILWLLGMLLIHPFVAIVYRYTDYKKNP
jgi:hypothetical protein